jgi:hypothetical protein
MDFHYGKSLDDAMLLGFARQPRIPEGCLGALARSAH